MWLGERRLPIALWFLAATVTAVGCGPRSAPVAGRNPAAGRAKKAVDVEALRPHVAAFCGDCHAVPPAASFSKEEWEREVLRGFEFYRSSGRLDLTEPNQGEVVAYFRAQAPEKLVFPAVSMASHALPVRFRRQTLPTPDRLPNAAVSSLRWHVPAGSAAGQLLFTDMHHQDAGIVDFGPELRYRSLGKLGNPAGVEPTDLDADGRLDYLVSDLGSFFPEDHNRGRVVWLHQSAEVGWSPVVLADRLGRVAQTAAGDFDGDGGTDVLVAEFGFIQTGKLLLLRRSGETAGVPQFEQVVLDPRHGFSHLRPLDWDHDGDLDFVALVSQEHEKVELFLNDGSGKFQIHTLFAADDPTFGSSGIELVDLDGDGDLDVLHTNGDAMDNGKLKPYHAVRWLENAGSFPFTPHELTPLPGAFCAVAADFDGDKDLDVMAVAFPPATTREDEVPSFDELVFLEQTGPGHFVRHSMQAPSGGVTLAAADFDGDGDVDLAQGSFSQKARDNWITIWWNDGIAKSTPSSAQ